VHILIATTGALSPEPVADFAARLVGEDGRVSVITVIEVPRSFLEAIRSEEWHPLEAGATEAAWAPQEDAVISRYVEERGRRVTEPVAAALEAVGITPEVLYVEGEDPATRIGSVANRLNVDAIVLGATRQIFTDSAWESVSTRVIRDCGIPVLVLPAVRRNGAPEAEKAAD
jgi:nucleotide-binding universal stress UspA family protein